MTSLKPGWIGVFVAPGSLTVNISSATESGRLRIVWSRFASSPVRGFDSGWVTTSEPHCPFALDRSELFIMYAADAEVGVFLKLGWPPPLCILDLFPEFLRVRNGIKRPGEKGGLINALAFFGEPAMGAEEKQSFRDIAIRGGPFTAAEETLLLDYCEADVEATRRLLQRMWDRAMLDHPKVFKQAIWRGRYAAAVAAIRATGVPLNVALPKQLGAHWKDIKLALVARLGERYDVYNGTSFNFKKFEAYLKRVGLLRFWPRLDSGRTRVG